VNDELERMRKEGVVAYFEEMSQCLEVLKKTTKKLSQESQCQVSSIQKLETLLLKSTSAVIRCFR
jgi:hypothetical protein